MATAGGRQREAAIATAMGAGLTADRARRAVAASYSAVGVAVIPQCAMAVADCASVA